MKRERIVQLYGDFEQLVQKDTKFVIEHRMARNFLEVLGYARWGNSSAMKLRKS